ncbi:TPA: exo-alpha-sialidase [Photobacterium damselae]|uniref:exo-alpha-sialidase n=1 Tax=Photobacterium damselae TaxID=38293 RepID=UPI004068C5B0
MRVFKKRLLTGCILSFLSAPLAAHVYQFIPSDNPTNDEPIEQGWNNYLSNSGYGEAVVNQGVDEWYVNGNDGRANWTITPTTELNNQATRYGWTLSTEMRVVSGGYITNYYANGQHRFLPIISLQNGNLVAEFEGSSGTTILASGDDAHGYHKYDIVFHPGPNPTASFFFDGALIKSDWQGHPSSQNMIAWGNGSSSQAGEAYYRSITFTISGDPVFSTPDRIPSLVTSSQTPGTVAIFAEKRMGSGDPGAVTNTNDIITRISKDYGRTWGPEVNLTEQINLNDEYDFSDPRPIYLPQQDTITVSYVRWPTDAAQNGDKIKPWMASGVFYSTYDVANDTWSAPINVSSHVKEKTLQIVGWSGSEFYSKSLDEISSQNSWFLQSKLKIYNGKDNDLVVANGTKQYKISFAVNENGLVAYLDDQNSAKLIRTTIQNIAGFINVAMDFDPVTQTAQLTIDDAVVGTLSGIPSADKHILFGQTNAAHDGRLHIANINLNVNGQRVIDYDAETLTDINPNEMNNTPESQGWSKHKSGRAYSFYGVASVNPGPGHGIELKHQTEVTGNNNGRIIYPAITLDKYFLNVASVFSDDQGVTWDMASHLPVPYRWLPNRLETLEPSETDIVELNNGDILLTARLDFNQTVNNINYGPRHQFISHDGGMTWHMPENYGYQQFSNLSKNTVDASITRFTESDGSNYLLFTNPIGDLANNSGRENLGLWMSFDEGASWQGPIQLVNGGSAYSDIYQLDNENAMVIVEDNSRKIRVLTVPVTKIKQLLQ